jgi:hypothetical protein
MLVSCADIEISKTPCNEFLCVLRQAVLDSCHLRSGSTKISAELKSNLTLNGIINRTGGQTVVNMEGSSSVTQRNLVSSTEKVRENLCGMIQYIGLLSTKQGCCLHTSTHHHAR